MEEKSRLRLLKLVDYLGIGKKDFSDKIGVSSGNFSNWINTKNSPSFTALSQMCEIFNVNLNWLVTGKGPMFLTDMSGAVIDAENKFAVDTSKFHAKIDVPPSPLAGLTEKQLQELFYNIEEKLKALEQRIETLESKK